MFTFAGRAKLGPEYEALIGTVRNVGSRRCAQPGRAGMVGSDGVDFSDDEVESVEDVDAMSLPGQ